MIIFTLSALISCTSLHKSSTPGPQVSDSEFDDDKDLELTYLAKFLFHEIDGR